MRALSACLTVVLGLGVAAIAACSSSSSDDTAGGGTGGASTAGTSAGGKSSGGTSAGGSSAGTHAGGASTAGTGGGIGAAGAGGEPACPFIDACSPCIANNCGNEETACLQDEACDKALASGDMNTLLMCACGGMKTIAQCTETFSMVNAAAKTVADCAKANCKTECGL